MKPLASSWILLCGLLVGSPSPRAAGDESTGHPGDAGPGVSATGPARPATEAERRSVAREHYKKGRQLFDARRFREAITELRAAVTLWPRREIYFNIGLCHYELGERLEAARNIWRSLEGVGVKERRALPKALRTLLARVGVVRVSVSQADAEIWIDGKLRGRRQVVLVVEPGEVSVEVRMTGRTVSRRKLQVDAGAQVQWELDAMGQEHGGGVRTIRRSTGDESAAARGSRRRLPWSWLAGAGGLAVVAAGVAIGLGAKTRALHEEYLESPSVNLRTEGRGFQAATNVVWGIAGVAAVSAAVLAVFTRFKREPAQTSSWTPCLLPGGAGLVAHF